MKLAEALQERADLNVKIEQLRARLENNAIVQDGEQPAENPAALLSDLDASVLRLEELMACINRTNCATAATVSPGVSLKDGATVTDLIAKRDALRLHIQAYRETVSAASQATRRATHTEIRILRTVDVQALQQKTDAMAKQLRLVDNAIQELNWKTELL